MINSSLGNLSPFWKRVQPKAILQFVKIALASNGKGKEKLILELTSHNQKNADKIFPKWEEIGKVANMSFANTVRQVLAGFKFKPGVAPKIPYFLASSLQCRG
jgi:hypothetical protein